MTIERHLTDNDVSRITGRARSTLQKDRVAGIGIPFIRIGRLVRYRESDVQEYLAGLPSYRSTSEATVAEGCHATSETGGLEPGVTQVIADHESDSDRPSAGRR